MYILLITFAGATASPAQTADAAAFCSTLVYCFLLSATGRGLPSTRTREGKWPKVLVYQNRVVGAATPRYIGYGR